MFKKETAAQKAQKALFLAAARVDAEELIAHGYQIHEFTPWHWRITRKPDWKLEADVWPTVNKLMDRETWRPQKYTSLFKAVEELFHRPEYAA